MYQKQKGLARNSENFAKPYMIGNEPVNSIRWHGGEKTQGLSSLDSANLKSEVSNFRI
jgi:hypothetical protein